ncbi:MerR family transcriptional regulator [Agromyces binzhouensis]|uniref:MerR family transcriptional regulator n=1 Tax=Agromyces binzhouensis TaxID=1817495 RepID=UPI00363C01E2
MSWSNVVSTMYTIGEFAAFGRVSVRMLRHYDAIGLLEPAHVDEHSGYRRYSSAQLQRLLRIVELRGYGIGLDRIAVALAGDEVGGLHDALAERRADLAASVADDTVRLARLERRLRLLEGTETMSDTIEYRTVEPVTVYATSMVAHGMGPENVGPVVGPAIARLDDALTSAGRPLIEPGIFWYEPVEGSDDLAVHVSYTAEPEPQPGEGYDIVTLPAVATMATLIHRGDMIGIGQSWSTLVDGIVAEGYRITGPTREVYLVADGHEPGPDWVTELQAPVEREA